MQDLRQWPRKAGPGRVSCALLRVRVSTSLFLICISVPHERHGGYDILARKICRVMLPRKSTGHVKQCNLKCGRHYRRKFSKFSYAYARDSPILCNILKELPTENEAKGLKAEN